MPTNIDKWKIELGSLAKKVPTEAMSAMVRKIGFEALRGVVLRSPVGNPKLWKSPPPPGYVGGRFRNNWFIDINGINPSIRDKVDATGSASMKEGSKLETLRSNPYVTVYIHNSLPYATALENGHSSQAPVGIVAVTVQSISTILK